MVFWRVELSSFEEEFLLTQIYFQDFTTAMMTLYKRVSHRWFKNRENVLFKMRRFLRSCSHSRRWSILWWYLYRVSERPYISSARKQILSEQKALLQYWKGNNTIRNQLMEDIGFKSSVFGGKFHLFLSNLWLGGRRTLFTI